jgi:hypothetical protein
VSFTLGCYYRGGCSAVLTEKDGGPGDATIADIMTRHGWTWAGTVLLCPTHTRKAKDMASKKRKKAAPGPAGGTFTEGENPRPKGTQETLHREKHRKPYTRELPVDANDREVADLARELADVLLEEAKVKEKRRNATAGFRDQLAGFDDRKKKLSECVHSSRKLVPVRVQEYQLATGEIEVVRIDSGEVVDRRTAEAEDRQRDIEDDLD